MTETLMDKIQRTTTQRYGIHQGTAFLDFSVTRTAVKSTRESPWMASDTFWKIQPFAEKGKPQPYPSARRSQTPENALVTKGRPRKRSLYSF